MSIVSTVSVAIGSSVNSSHRPTDALSLAVYVAIKKLAAKENEQRMLLEERSRLLILRDYLALNEQTIADAEQELVETWVISRIVHSSAVWPTR